MAATSFLFLLLILTGLPLLAGLILLALSRRGGLGFPSCGTCRYNVTGTVGTATRCPECGAEFLKVGIIPPRGRRNPVMLWLGVALVALPLTCFGSLLVISTMHARQSAMAAQRAAVAQQLAAQAAAAQLQAQPAQPQPATTETKPDADNTDHVLTSRGLSSR